MTSEAYHGYEMGPIRPPSEARSLLLRVTRNCHWNRCSFCPVYKEAVFSVRSTEHVLRDIDMIAKYVGVITSDLSQQVGQKIQPMDILAYRAAIMWYRQGMKSIFIQDADSLVIPPKEMVLILRRLRERFSSIERVTSYARSSTVAKISDGDLQAIRDAGLNRIHIGLESGSNNVLKMVRKGASKLIHVKAGKNVKKAGMELSEYVIPGLGGRKFSEEHAIETADAINQISPDFIRLRQLAIPNRSPMSSKVVSGEFDKLTDSEVVRELRRFIEHLDRIDSYLISDHILNLLPEIEGYLPQDKDRLLSIIDSYLEMDLEQQLLYQLGKRMGIFYSMRDLRDPVKLSRAELASERYQVTSENISAITDELMKRFI